MSNLTTPIRRPTGFIGVVSLLILAGLYLASISLDLMIHMFQILFLDVDVGINAFNETTKFFGPISGIFLEPIFDLIGWLYLGTLVTTFKFSLGIAMIVFTIGFWKRKRWSYLSLITILSIELLISIFSTADLIPQNDFIFQLNIFIMGFFGFMLFYLGTKRVKIFIN